VRDLVEKQVVEAEAVPLTDISLFVDQVLTGGVRRSVFFFFISLN
jgi:hypothetical protein